MRTYCIKNHETGFIFKVLMTLEEVEIFFEKNPEMKECVDCIECDDAPSIMIE